MRVYQVLGELKYVDAAGNVYILTPATSVDAVKGINNYVQLSGDGLKDLLAAGPIVLTPKDYGDEFPENPVEGQLFFKKV